jgi:hypothetical protein
VVISKRRRLAPGVARRITALDDLDGRKWVRPARDSKGPSTSARALLDDLDGVDLPRNLVRAADGDVQTSLSS